ncbi:MAG: low molecular weight protein arginine phosphatase [Candidatus Omnitrophica bacterium]|nr:low molecular weight protein arginine phosphatase [Candidatus Omnitrophota bacterium]
MSAQHLLFVCTGNSCRSVMAQGLMQQALTRLGRQDVQVDSAGIFAIEGMSATRETLNVLQAVGVDASHHRARGLAAEQVEAADLIFVMERLHADEVVRRFPPAAHKVHLLKPYGVPPGVLMGSPGIPDPIGKPLEVYEVCFAEIREAVDRIAKSLTDVPRS